MKIRNGFVSNSSSSSFIVAFPHKPGSVEDIKSMMFGKQEWHYTSHHQENKQDFPTKEIAEAVFNDIKEEATEEEIHESIKDGWFEYYLLPGLLPGMYSSSEETKGMVYARDKEKMEIIWKEAEKINDKRAKDIAEAFKRGHTDNYIVVLRYCDNESSLQSILEHTNIFNRLDFIKTSYH